MCHSSGGVVPCVDAQSSRRHTLGAPVKIEMEMRRTSHRSSGMFVSALQMWLMKGSTYSTVLLLGSQL